MQTVQGPVHVNVLAGTVLRAAGAPGQVHVKVNVLAGAVVRAAGTTGAPFNIAVAFVTGGAGLGAFTEETVRDERILGLASKVKYVVDPNNPYPKAYTGHVRMTLKDGRVIEERQPHIRGGAHEPLTRADIEAKFCGNCEYGGWSRERAQRFLDGVPGFFDDPLDLAPLRG